MVDEMKAIAVVGAAGIVGKSVIDHFVDNDKLDRIVAVDKQPMRFSSQKVEEFQLNIFNNSLVEALLGCSSVIYLIEDPKRRADKASAIRSLSRVLEAVKKANCGHFVILSSAMVYGANNSNPIPITESFEARSLDGLSHADIKLSLEEAATTFCSKSKISLAILRPTVTVSKNRMSLISSEVMSARFTKIDLAETPTQYLHLDDLASAIALASFKSLDGVFNVAPDDWIGPAELKDLSPDPDQKLEGKLRELYLTILKMSGLAEIPQGLEAYINSPWVVSNDKLRNAGWVPKYTNEEAYVSHIRTPYWQILFLRYRQELSLAGVGSAILGSAIGFVYLMNKLFRKK